MAKFCSNCGKPLKANANFCGSCGKKIVRRSAEISDSDLMIMGGGAVLGTALAQNQVSAQQSTMNAPPPATDVNSFFGFASNSLQEITGATDVTNIVAHVAHRIGVENIAEYIDVTTDAADALIDNAADIVGDVAGEAAGEVAGNLVGTLFDIITS